jgi:hypothetical protein
MAVNFQHTSELKIHKWIVCSAALNRSPAALQLLPVRAHAGATVSRRQSFCAEIYPPDASASSARGCPQQSRAPEEHFPQNSRRIASVFNSLYKAMAAS